MNTAIRLSTHIRVVLLILVAAGSAQAQAQTPAAAEREKFENRGEVTVGYRFTDVSGYAPQYQQMFDLKDGFRLFDFTLHGTSPDRNNPFADRYALTASGLGGDPFSTAELQAGKTNLYDFRAQWRQSTYSVSYTHLTLP